MIIDTMNTITEHIAKAKLIIVIPSSNSNGNVYHYYDNYDNYIPIKISIQHCYSDPLSFNYTNSITYNNATSYYSYDVNDSNCTWTIR